MDYLVHHGILGQKWGIRRYQPYSTVPRGSGKSGKEIGEARKIGKSIKKQNKLYGKKFLKEYDKEQQIIKDSSLYKTAKKEMSKLNKSEKNLNDKSEKILSDYNEEKQKYYGVIDSLSILGIEEDIRIRDYFKEIPYSRYTNESDKMISFLRGSGKMNDAMKIYDDYEKNRSEKVKVGEKVIKDIIGEYDQPIKNNMTQTVSKDIVQKIIHEEPNDKAVNKIFNACKTWNEYSDEYPNNDNYNKAKKILSDFDVNETNMEERFQEISSAIKKSGIDDGNNITIFSELNDETINKIKKYM